MDWILGDRLLFRVTQSVAKSPGEVVSVVFSEKDDMIVKMIQIYKYNEDY
jgi:hypothetical protein